MTQLVLTLTQTPANEVQTSESWLTRLGATKAPSRDIVALGFVLAILQILDGILTAIGVHTFGLHAEANILIRHAMALIGTVPALVILKTLALCIIAALCMMAQRVQWLKIAMRGVAALYVLAAIVPWSTILAIKFLS